MIKRELAKDPKLAQESWDRFLPKFKKKNVKRKKASKKEKKPYTPFPPPQTPSKLDLQLESGEYFLTEYQKEQRKRKERAQKRWEDSQLKKADRQKVFVPPQVRLSCSYGLDSSSLFPAHISSAGGGRRVTEAKATCRTHCYRAQRPCPCKRG